MRPKILISVFLLIGIAFCFTELQAQTTTEVRSGTVTSVQGNHVIIKMSTGEEKHFDVPDDFRLTVDGKEISVHELKPGTKLTRTITTTTEPKTVYTSVVKQGTVWHAQGTTVIITGADRQNRQYTVPDWIKFEVDGKEVSVYDLKKGMRVSATIVTETPSTVVTSTPGGVSGSAPAEPAAAAPTPAPAPAAEPMAEPAAEPKKTLPKTASNIELLALLGVGLLFLSWKLR
ncbi:hypothetical protein L0244_35335 [bacterium]|nr:hypothetical protein [bacterium]MCI0618282.1 hypothetical protein [bacterium]